MQHTDFRHAHLPELCTNLVPTLPSLYLQKNVRVYHEMHVKAVMHENTCYRSAGNALFASAGLCTTQLTSRA